GGRVRSPVRPLRLTGRARAELRRVRGPADRRRSAAHGGVGLLRSRLSARGDREPLSLPHGEGALRGAARRGARTRRPDRLHAGDAARLERPLRASARQALDVVQRRDRADSDVSVAPDARISAALRAADVSLLGLERAAMAGRVLLAGRGLAALGAIWRRAHEPRHEAPAPPWPRSCCGPAGSLRRWEQYGGARMSLVMPPELILDIRNAAKTLGMERPGEADIFVFE